MISQRRLILTACAGTLFEMYDFTLYILFSPIIAELFFPFQQAHWSKIFTLSVLALGYVARPIGALIFGSMGDRIGRRQTLFVTLCVMALPSLLIVILPSYAQIGALAPCLLVILRLIQGMALGGEFSGGVIYVAEFANPKRRGWAISWVIASINLGVLLAIILTYLITSYTTPLQLSTWGWRVVYLMGGTLALIGVYLRFKGYETPVYQRFRMDHLITPDRIKALKNNGGSLLRGFLILIGVATGNGFAVLRLPTILINSVQLNTTQALLLDGLLIILLSGSQPFIGLAIDRWGRKPILITGLIGTAIFPYPFIYALSHNQFALAIFFLALVILSVAATLAVFATILIELYPTGIRYLSVSMVYNCAFALFAGTLPLIITLTHIAFQSKEAISYYLALTALISLLASIGLPETKNTTLLGAPDHG